VDRNRAAATSPPKKIGIWAEHDDRADGLRINSPLVRIGWPLQLGQIVQTIESFCLRMFPKASPRTISSAE
jgi:hypothetical protein